MRFKLFAVLLVVLIVALFGVQNAAAITVRFLHWEFTLPQGLVIVIAAAAGALIGLIVGSLGGRRRPAPPAAAEKPAPRSDLGAR